MERRKIGPPAARPTAMAKAQPPKKKSSGKLILTLVLVFLVIGLAAGGVVCYLYDYFSLRSNMVAFFITQDEQYQTRMAALDQREAALNEREAVLNETARKQESTDKKQQSEQERLDARKAELDAQDTDLSARITAFDSSLAEFDNVVQTVAAMDPKNAAAMLETLWPTQDAAKILNAMAPKKAGAILDKMTTDGAKAITEQLIVLSQ